MERGSASTEVTMCGVYWSYDFGSSFFLWLVLLPHVGRIAQQHARLGGFAASSSPSPEALVDEDSDDDGDDEDASFLSDDKMTTSQ